jgi:hypothetical protein
MTATTVNEARSDVVGSVKSSFLTLLHMVLFAVVVAHPLSWLWDNVLVGLVNVVNPFGDDYWASVALVVGLTALLHFGLSVAKAVASFDVSDPVASVVRVVTASVPIWGAFLVVWAIVEYLV